MAHKLRTKMKVTTFTPPLFVMQQMYHDYHFYSVISHSIQHCTFRIFKGLANYNSMKMLGAFPVESYGELGRHPLFKD